MSEQRSSRQVAIIAYRSRRGEEDTLLGLTREHLPLLRREGLSTERPVVVCRAKDGTLIEVFESGEGGISLAHVNPAVQALWAGYAAVADYVPLASLAEAADTFAGFSRSGSR